MNKKVLLINDFAGYGKISLTAMMPILTDFKNYVYNLPTAIVSNTLDYGKFEILDTTKYMEGTIRVWNELGFTFDYISTGFINSKEQIPIIKNFTDHHQAFLMVDPIMADNGKLYNGIYQDTVENMKQLIAGADLICPNLTEAQFLTDSEIAKKDLTKDEAFDIVRKLHHMGARSVVVTGVRIGADHSILGFDADKEQLFEVPFEYIPVHFTGTGDIFSGVLLSYIIEKKELKECVRLANLFMHRIISECKDQDDKTKGIAVENFLDRLGE